MGHIYTEICYVVRDMDKTLRKWSEVTGAGPFYLTSNNAFKDMDIHNRIYRGKPAEDTVQGAFGFLGDTLLEFVQPTNDKPSIFREFLDRKGETSPQIKHHVYPSLKSLSPAEYDAEFARYIKNGLEPVYTLSVPYLGSVRRNSFFDGVAHFGCFFELIEMPPAGLDMIAKMHTEHLGWDGSNPMRKHPLS